MGEHISFRKNQGLLTVKPYWRGNPVVRGRFVNRQHRWKAGVGNVLKWRFSLNPQREEKRNENWEPQLFPVNSLQSVEGDLFIWLGHNSFFMQLAGKRIMFDPVFGHIPFVRRKSKFPADPAVFQNIDYLLISHDHFDHMDKASILQLYKNNPQMKAFCGLGVGELIQGWCPRMEVIEAGWYQQVEDGKLKITFLPAQHWSKRSLNDGGLRLWGAFMLQSDHLTVYYGGDTGYSSHFMEIQELFGKPDYALLGIGAYKPRWFMRPNHISPYDSLTASSEMQAAVTIPMHYGTFDLSDEPLSDPPTVFAEEARKRNMHVEIPALGEIVRMKRNLLLIISFIFIAMTACNIEKPASKCEAHIVLENISARKSVRKYLPKAVEKEKLQLMLKAAMAAPTGKDTRPWEFIVVDDRETLNKMADGLPYAKMLKDATVAIVVCGDTTKSFYWYLDCALAGQNILLSAEALGLGAVWTATYPYPERMDVVKECLNLPEHINSLCVIPVGYPITDNKPKDKWDESRIHHNKW